MSFLNVLHLKSKTNASCPDLSGEGYTASFETHSFARGPRKKIYHGHLGGSGPRKGEDAVVKVFRDQMGTEELCDAEIEKHQLARDLAEQFNSLIPDDRSKLTFTLPMKSRVEALGIATHFSRHKHHHRSIDKQEWVLMEENLVRTGEYQVFIRKTGKRLTNDPTSLDAFLHFAYHESGGEFVMCGFQGVHTKKGYKLTTPCFHSIDHRFGDSVDKGYDGIVEAFSHHQCNNLCYELMEKPVAEPKPEGEEEGGEEGVEEDGTEGKRGDDGVHDDDGGEEKDRKLTITLQNGFQNGDGGDAEEEEKEEEKGEEKEKEDETKKKTASPTYRSHTVTIGTMPNKRPSF